MPAYFDHSMSQWRWRKQGIKLPDGSKAKQISGTPAINTKKAAEDAERDAIEALLEKARLGLDPYGASVKDQRKPKAVPLFETFAHDWLTKAVVAEGLRPSTMKAHASNLRVHLLPALTGKRLDEITPQVFDTLVASLKGTKFHGGLLGNKVVDRGGRPALKNRNVLTIRNVTNTLRKLLRCAVGYGLITNLPKMTKLRVPKEIPFEFYSVEEADKLVAAASSDEERALFMFALRTGVREGEQMAVRWDDLQFFDAKGGERAKVIIRWNFHDGVEGPTKTGYNREIPLSATLTAALRAIEPASRARGKLVFSNEHGRHLGLSSLRYTMTDACERAGIRRLRWHDLRHTFASHIMIGGVPIKQLQAWLGHQDIKMTMRYAHLQPSMTDQMIDILDAPRPARRMGKVLVMR